jgi:hypothetical protein
VTNTSPQPTPAPSSLFLKSLLLLLAFGVAGLGWLLLYTDWYESVGGILALGGALSWLAFVSRVMKKERLEQLQDWADAAIFNNPRTPWVVSALLAGGVVAACFVGTLELRSGSGALLERAVSVRRPGGETTAGLRGSVRLPLFTTWWSPARVRVKISGYPEADATVMPWSRTTLVAPDHFLRPVVVLRPDKDLLDKLVNNPKTLVVEQTSSSGPPKTARLVGYHGQAVWVGCDEDVDVPDSVLETWKSELAARDQSAMLSLWSHPLALPEGPEALKQGDRLVAKILSGGERRYADAEIVVRSVRTARDFPQEEEIHVHVQADDTPPPP